jgi:RNA polymerase sigma factor (sigma-70 family)
VAASNDAEGRPSDRRPQARRNIGREEESALVTAAKAGDREALGKLLEAHLPLILREARGYARKGVPLEDLVGEGCFGVVEALSRFDAMRNVRFMTYAIWWVRRRLVVALSTQGRNVRIPRRALAQASAARRDAPREGATPMAPYAREVSLGDFGEGSEMRASDVLRDPSPSPEACAQFSESSRLARRAVDRLPPRERSILALRFGLSGADPMTLPELATQLGVSKERIRQLEHRALQRIRADMGIDG